MHRKLSFCCRRRYELHREAAGTSVDDSDAVRSAEAAVDSSGLRHRSSATHHTETPEPSPPERREPSETTPQRSPTILPGDFSAAELQQFRKMYSALYEGEAENLTASMMNTG
eukprot:gnl/TRDRNA2_/TRDRNA2_189433_c0_seq1.p1 gnl/TRDRNA2_/TRDRNA2_189433_c0~~gnl/TRDRNA2_/TRDRNA2_189433_c0_seq1.p1  ORF type:complete len:113 (+),score=24.11 gnl/TRDRNA2_/TRDRNA2_189433_c0_seq1:111-449(+)